MRDLNDKKSDDDMTKIRVTVERIDGYCNLPMLVGDHFSVEGSRIFIPEGKYICLWALQSMMPVFPLLNVKESLKNGHWAKKVTHFSCPDPKGRVLYRLEVVE
jgi:carbon-monoxide dehydrogenase iron sulfur subunit